MSISVSWGCSASQPKDNCPPIPSASPNMQPGLEFKGSICRCHVKTLLFTYLLLWSYVDTQPQLSRGPQGDQPSQKVKQKYTNHNCFKPYRVCGSCSTNKTPCRICSPLDRSCWKHNRKTGCQLPTAGSAGGHGTATSQGVALYWPCFYTHK